MTHIITLVKRCSKCRIFQPIDNFYKDKRATDGLYSCCSACSIKSTRKWQKRNPKNVKKAVKKYRQTDKYKVTKAKNANTYRNTIAEYLQEMYYHIIRRCNNPKVHNYKNYGGRGIKCLFGSSDKFINYVINGLKTDPRGLQIDRINNNGNYEPGNIRFVTAKENSNNRRNSK